MIRNSQRLTVDWNHLAANIHISELSQELQNSTPSNEATSDPKADKTQNDDSSDEVARAVPPPKVQLPLRAQSGCTKEECWSANLSRRSSATLEECEACQHTPVSLQDLPSFQKCLPDVEIENMEDRPCKGD